MPQRPKTTDGTTAIRSIRLTSGRRSHGGATWVMNRAMPRLTGTATTTAIERREHRAVDERQRAVHVVGRAPSAWSVKNDSPMSCSVGQAWRVIVTTIRARITTIAPPASSVIHWKVPSASCTRWRSPRRTSSWAAGWPICWWSSRGEVRSCGWMGGRGRRRRLTRPGGRPGLVSGVAASGGSGADHGDVRLADRHGCRGQRSVVQLLEPGPDRRRSPDRSRKYCSAAAVSASGCVVYTMIQVWAAIG